VHGDDYEMMAGELAAAVTRQEQTFQHEDYRIIDVDGNPRWGGEEFIILSPETEKQSAFVLAERVRREVAGHEFPVVQHVTSSFGITSFDENNDDERTFLGRVDDALYNAKNRGRNRTEML
jgi:diguanylate cyclase (GGDEF)-like protein